ncbi:MAG: hypothetical protein KAT17_08350 [Candidatus Aminicenantes bacterium]|nr:hypothetical protein [Candidatus Aminicenantes bacterium]
MNLKKGFILLIFTTLVLTPIFSSQAEKYRNEDCLYCHGKPGHSQITPDGKTRSLVVDPDEWSQDVHQKKGMVCVDCHLYASPFIHFREGYIPVNCARCHPQEEEEYQKNIHLSFRPSAITPGKELPECYHCHTTHHVLKHDDPSASIHEDNIGDTCSACHAEVMVRGILKGYSLGKISGHRKGDLGEKFDLNVCINCHYVDSAHGNKRAYKVFCSRCHDPRSKGNLVMGGTHIHSSRWSKLNIAAVGILLLFFIGVFVFRGFRLSGRIWHRIKKMAEELKEEKETADQPDESEGQKSE